MISVPANPHRLGSEAAGIPAMKFGVLQFPASNCDQDSVHVLGVVLGCSVRTIWHKETSLGGLAVNVPDC